MSVGEPGGLDDERFRYLDFQISSPIVREVLREPPMIRLGELVLPTSPGEGRPCLDKHDE